MKRARAEAIGMLFTGYEIFASTHSIATTYYYARKNLKISNDSFREFVSSIIPITVSSETLDMAFDIADGSDLEDAIQIAACKQYGVKNFATADKKLAKLYSNLLNIELVN